METVRHITVTYSLGDLADWVSAFATVAAVMFSLYLSNHVKKSKIFITFTDKSQVNCRITNKSFRPVELKLKEPGKNKYDLFGLPPMIDHIVNIKDSQPFNKDYMSFTFQPKDNKTILKSKGIDMVTNNKYYFIFFKSKDNWRIKQYRFWITWILAMGWWQFYKISQPLLTGIRNALPNNY